MKINVIPVAYEKFCLLMNLPRGKDERVDKYPESIRKVLMFFYTPSFKLLNVNMANMIHIKWL
jgi:hypothetical protein